MVVSRIMLHNLNITGRGWRRQEQIYKPFDQDTVEDVRLS